MQTIFISFAFHAGAHKIQINKPRERHKSRSLKTAQDRAAYAMDFPLKAFIAGCCPFSAQTRTASAAAFRTLS